MRCSHQKLLFWISATFLWPAEKAQLNQISGPLEIHRSAKHLVLDLPIGSKEGAYDLALLSDTGGQIIAASGTAQLLDHVVSLRADVDVSSVEPGLYFLALRQPGLEWTKYLVRVS